VGDEAVRPAAFPADGDPAAVDPVVEGGGGHVQLGGEVLEPPFALAGFLAGWRRPGPVDTAGGAVQAAHEVTDGGRRDASAAFRGSKAIGFEAVRDSGGSAALACEFADPIGQLRVVAELLQPLNRADDLSRGGGSAGPDDGDLHPLAGAPAR
jgi:hypothetical protein